jgi:AraC-like DNA-binding protein
MRRVRDDGLPIAVARSFSLEQYPVLGFTVMTAATCRDAIVRVVRFGSIVTTSSRWTIEEVDDVARLRFLREGPRTLGHRVANESAVAEFVHAARQMLGSEAPPLSVSFRHPAPLDTRAHRNHFGSRIVWGADEDGLVFPGSMLDAVPRLSNPALFAHFEREAERALERSTSGATAVARVREAVLRALPSGEPDTARIAKQLAMSERTLRRTLAAEGSSFRAIVDRTRQERALLLLRSRQASLAEIALSLGFSELSAFSRAFKRWTGQSPREARDQKV